MPMNKFTLLIAAVLIVLLAGCTLTFLPDDGSAVQNSHPVTVNPKPVGATPQPVRPQPVLPQLAIPQNEAVRYVCSTASLAVKYSNNYNLAEVFYDGIWNQLPRQGTTASGIAFANSTYTWTASGRDAFLTKNGSLVADNCYYTIN